MNKTKIIGLSGGSSDSEGFIRSGINEMYVKAILKAGATPVIIPIHQDKEAIKHQISIIDGLVLTGGVDIHPKYFKQEIMKDCGEFDVYRDEFEMLLVEEATKENLPILGICRGIQLLNVFYKGTLFQDIAKKSEFFIKHSQNGSRGFGSHFISIARDSFLYPIYGKTGFVNSYHHQAIDKLADNFEIVAQSADGIIEAIQDKYKRIYGVQFHPEMMIANDKESLNIFEFFLSEIKKKYIWNKNI